MPPSTLRGFISTTAPEVVRFSSSAWKLRVWCSPVLKLKSPSPEEKMEGRVYLQVRGKVYPPAV